MTMRDDGSPRSRLRSLISGAETVDRRTTCQGGAGRVGRARGRDAMRFDAVHASVAARRAIISCMSNATTTARGHHARHTGRPSVRPSWCLSLGDISRYVNASRRIHESVRVCHFLTNKTIDRRYPCCLLLSHFEYTPSSRRLFPAIMCKYNAIHKPEVHIV